MVNPVPNYSVSVAYRKPNNGMWNACGFHTGQDYSAPLGTAIVSARSGHIAHVDYGPAFGYHQFVCRPGDGTEDFYAHTSNRPSNGLYVSAGQHIANVGNEGNTKGPHLHFERHSGYGWNCNILQDPMLSHNANGQVAPPSDECSTQYPRPTSNTVYLSKLHFGQKNSDSCWYLQDALNKHPLTNGQTLPLTGCYLSETDEEVRLCQQQHGYGNDPVNASFVGMQQAQHLFPPDSGISVVS